MASKLRNRGTCHCISVVLKLWFFRQISVDDGVDLHVMFLPCNAQSFFHEGDMLLIVFYHKQKLKV